MKANEIAQVASGIIGLIEQGKEIYRVAASAMDTMENGPVRSGEEKKAWVMAYVKAFAISFGANWEDYVKLVASFINQIKSVYNLVKGMF